MCRPSSKSLVMLLLALPALSAFAQPDDEVLLRVRVTDVEFTDYYPEGDCPSEAECIEVNFWFRYEANVREVIRGTYERSGVKFARLQHAYFARKPRDWYLLLVRCGESVQAAVGVEYCVKDEAFASDTTGVKRLVGARHGA